MFAPVYGPPFVRDLEGKRRYATIEDFRNFVKLAYMAPAMHHSGGTVCEPVDIPVNKRHLDMVAAHMTLSDKPFMGSVTAPERADDTVAMAQILFGEEFVDQNCVITSLINCNSPLVIDATMLGALKVYAKANQATVISPFIVGGAMSPVTVAGTLTQVLCEATSAIALTQLCRPGAPVIFGTFATAISMQSGAPTFGTPEPAMVLMAAAQFARRYNLPFRSGGSLTGSKLPDAQAAYESANTLWPTMAGRRQFHAACGRMARRRAGIVLRKIHHGRRPARCRAKNGGRRRHERKRPGDERDPRGRAGQPLSRLHPHAGEFPDRVPRLQCRRQQFLRAVGTGRGKRTEERANAIARHWLEQYEAPALDPAIADALSEFVRQQKGIDARRLHLKGRGDRRGQ